MTVSEFYSFSIRPNGIVMDFSNKEELIGELFEYCSDIQYIKVHMKHIKKQRLRLKLKRKILNLFVKFLKLEVLRNSFQIN